MTETVELSSNDESIDGLINTVEMTESREVLGVIQSEDMSSPKESGNNPSVFANRKKKVVRRSFTLLMKLKVIKWFKDNGNNKTKTANHFHTTRQNIQNWVAMEDILKKQLKDSSVRVANRRRVSKARNPMFPEVDRKVKEWFDSQRANRIVVTSDGIISKALDVFPKTCPAQGVKFKASWGWLQGFLQRQRLSSRTATSVGQKIPQNARDISNLFFERVDNFRQQQTDQNFSVLNMDQMPMYFDSPTNKTYDSIGSRTVSVKTTGYEKLRFSLMLCAASDGRKCPPAIIFKGLKSVPKKEKFPKGIHIMVSKKGSVNSDLMDDWRTKVYAKRPGGLFFNYHFKRSNGPKYRSLLVIDSATPHRSLAFEKSMAKNNDTKVEIIPAGMTPLLQPADVSWNRSVKASVKRMWSEWIASPKGPKDMTKSGALKRPSYALVAKWCLQAWEDLPPKQIIDSFKYCNLGPKRDDSAVHSKLKDVLSCGSVTDTEIPEPSGLTDTESDVEESEEVIDYAEELTDQIDQEFDDTTN
jgi:hypothetical protein